MKDSDLTRYEANRDLAADVLQAVCEMKAGKMHVVLSPVAEVRENAGLSQAELQQVLHASVGSGTAGGAGAEAEQVFDRLESKYRQS